MPQYDFRCEACGRRFALHYQSVAAYANAKPVCPDCESADLARVISGVSIPQTGRDYRKMDSGEMLSVLESGEKKQVDEMFRQVHDSD